MTTCLLKSRKRYGIFFCKEEVLTLENLTQKYKETQEALKFSHAIQALHISLENALPEEFKSVLVQFDSLSADILTAHQNYFYRSGFWDCCDYVRERDANGQQTKKPIPGVSGLKAVMGYT